MFRLIKFRYFLKYVFKVTTRARVLIGCLPYESVGPHIVRYVT